MKTIVLTKYKLLTTGVDGGHKYLTAKIFNHGIESDLSIFFKEKQCENSFSESPVVALKGNFKEEENSSTITLYEAEEAELPTGNNWLTFFSNYFLDNGVDSFNIYENADGYSITTNMEDYHLWISISKENSRLNKLEFGRFLPLENPEHKLKSTSWTKGVFVNKQDGFIRFLQESFEGEEGNEYRVEFTEENQQLVMSFLTIPFLNGWTELDYRLDADNFYKAGGKALFENFVFENTFTLLDIGEQDIPFGIIDKFDQWLRTKRGDSNKNNHRRSIDETVVEPIQKNKVHYLNT